MSVRFASYEAKKLRDEVSRLASMANKRLKRLEKNEMTDSPAYQMWLKYDGGVRFSTKGKSYNELRKELARLNEFIEAKTSTVRGYNKVLKNMADYAGIHYRKISDLRQSSKNFFSLANKISEYLDAIEGSALAIGYQRIWESINNYVRQEKIDLSSAKIDIDSLSKKIGELTRYEKLDYYIEGYSEGDDHFEYF